MSALLQLRGVTRTFRRFGAPAREVLRGVDLEVQPGEVVGLVGRSGSGKTTIARIAMGLQRADAGDVVTLGEAPHRRRPRRAQMLFQDPGAALNPGLTLREMLSEAARAWGRPAADGLAALDRMGIAPRANALPHALSGGEKRRATLAMLTVADPLLVFADEPTAGLDAARKADVLDLLRAWMRPDRALVLVSHDLAVLRYVCSRMLVLDEGRIVEALPLAELDQARHPTTLKMLAAWSQGAWG